MKSITKMKELARNRRRLAIRKKLAGTPERPRLAVFRSLKHIYAQIIDDESGRTLVAMSTKAKGIEFPKELSVVLPTAGKANAEEGENQEKPKPVKLSRKMLESYIVGEKLGQKALEAGITNVAFDRAGFKYHGRVKALAEGARKAGLQF